MYVFSSECYVVSNECDVPTSCLVRPIGAHDDQVMYFGSFCLKGDIGFLNCDDLGLCLCLFIYI